jgi:glutamine synthetase adenylyltransferase
MTDLSRVRFDAYQQLLLEQLAETWEQRAQAARARWVAAPAGEKAAHAVEAELYRRCAGELGRAARRGALPMGPLSAAAGR